MNVDCEKRDVQDAGRLGEVNATRIIDVARNKVYVERQVVANVPDARIHHRIDAIPFSPKVDDHNSVASNYRVDRV